MDARVSHRRKSRLSFSRLFIMYTYMTLLDCSLYDAMRNDLYKPPTPFGVVTNNATTEKEVAMPTLSTTILNFLNTKGKKTMAQKNATTKKEVQKRKTPAMKAGEIQKPSIIPHAVCSGSYIKETAEKTLRSLKVKTHKWARFGNNIPNPMNALLELIMNAFAACQEAQALGQLTINDMRVDVQLIQCNGYAELRVLGAGIPIDWQKFLNYGDENHGTKLNQWGTGFKSAGGYFDPSNTNWAAYSKNGSQYEMVKAPYDSEMDVCGIDQWPFAEWVNSAIVIRITEPEKLEGLNALNCGFQCAFAIELHHLKLNFNGVPVTSVFPLGNYEIKKMFANIGGEQMSWDYIQMKYPEDAEGNAFYYPGLNTQGVYINVNGFFVARVGATVIKKSSVAKKSDDGEKYMKDHPSLNHHLVVLNINTPQNRAFDVPFNNNKTTIKWQSKIGKAYREAIDEQFGDFFRKPYENFLERMKRQFLDKFCGVAYKHMGYYETEYQIVPQKKSLRCDAVVGTQKNGDRIVPESVIKIYEFKVGMTNVDHIYNAIKYYDAFARKYKVHPHIIFVGNALEDEAREVVDQYRARGMDIDCVDWENSYLIPGENY